MAGRYFCWSCEVGSGLEQPDFIQIERCKFTQALLRMLPLTNCIHSNLLRLHSLCVCTSITSLPPFFQPWQPLKNYRHLKCLPIWFAWYYSDINFKVEPWQDGNSQLDPANVLRDIIAVAVSLTILIVAGFGIYNIRNMTVNEKIKEIGKTSFIV